MAERHREGIEAAIDRLEQVREELECNTDGHDPVIERELQKIKRKKLKMKKSLRAIAPTPYKVL